MIEHLKYIEDKELRDSLYQTLKEVFNKGNRYIAVDPEQILFASSKIYSFTNVPTFNNESKGYFGIDPTPIDMKFITIFNNHESEIYNIEKILDNWKEDQKENNILTEEKIKEIKGQVVQKILSQFHIEMNKPFKKLKTNNFFRINEEADVEIYETINDKNEWIKCQIYKLVDFIYDLYDDTEPVFDFNIDFEKEIKKNEISSETIKVIKSIIEINYDFIKIHPHENKISIHHNDTNHKTLFIYNIDKITIEWFLNFIKNNTTGNKILYISRLKTFWEEYDNESRITN